MPQRMVIKIPESPTDLEQVAIDEYNRAAKFSKGRSLLQLLEGGVILKQLGLLEYAVGLAATKELVSDDGMNELKSKMYKLLNQLEQGESPNTAHAPQQEAAPEVSRVVESLPNEGAQAEVVVSSAPEPIKRAVEVIKSEPVTVKREIAESEPIETPFRKATVTNPFNQSSGLGILMQIQTGVEHE